MGKMDHQCLGNSIGLRGKTGENGGLVLREFHWDEGGNGEKWANSALGTLSGCRGKNGEK